MTKAKPNLLVIDDDRNFRETLCELLTGKDYRVRTASNGKEALQLLQLEPADLALCDWKMPEMDGEEFLQALGTTADLLRMPVLIMTAYGTGPNALQAMHLGAYDFVTKPLDMVNTLQTIERALRHVELEHEVEQLRKLRFTQDGAEHESAHPGRTKPAQMVGSSPEWIQVFKDIGKVAKTDVGVLLEGESGTGKEMVARAIHDNSARRKAPLVIVNCAAIPPDLLESELFGHERGAFTGAVSRKIGKFEAADTGTIFLDEIGELPLFLQPKLLRVLQERTFERVGSETLMRTDVRVIAATNRTLEREVEAKAFRQDLFYRLNTYTLRLPPLRERISDIPALVEHFLGNFARRNFTPQQGITQEALTLLAQYTFPGNVRELEHLIDRAAVQAGNRAITRELIQSQVSNPPTERADQGLSGLLIDMPFHEAVSTLERRLLQRALEKSSGNKAEAARLLGIHRRLLYEKLQQYHLSS